MSAPNLRGRRFGRLTVVELALIRPHSTPGQTWRCICTCGNWAIRTTNMLKMALHRGHESMCQGCLEVFRGQLQRKRHSHTTRTMGRGTCHDDGLSFFFDAALSFEVMELLVEAFGPIPEASFDNDDIDPYLKP